MESFLAVTNAFDLKVSDAMERSLAIYAFESVLPESEEWCYFVQSRAMFPSPAL